MIANVVKEPAGMEANVVVLMVGDNKPMWLEC